MKYFSGLIKQSLHNLSSRKTLAVICKWRTMVLLQEPEGTQVYCIPIGIRLRTAKALRTERIPSYNLHFQVGILSRFYFTFAHTVRNGRQGDDSVSESCLFLFSFYLCISVCVCVCVMFSLASLAFMLWRFPVSAWAVVQSCIPSIIFCGVCH